MYTMHPLHVCARMRGGIFLSRVQMWKPGDFGVLCFVYKSLSEHLVLLCCQISNLSISAFPAVGVAWELSPASPHWAQAGRRGVPVLCQRLTWCSAEGLLVSSPFLLSPHSVSFFPNLNFGGHSGMGEGELLHTHAHTGMNYIHDIQTPTVCKGVNFFDSCM